MNLKRIECRKVEDFMSHWGQRHHPFLPANFLFFWYSYGVSFLLANLINCGTKVADLGGALPALACTHVPFEQMHNTGHCDWFKVGHMTQSYPIRVEPGICMYRATSS